MQGATEPFRISLGLGAALYDCRVGPFGRVEPNCGGSPPTRGGGMMRARAAGDVGEPGVRAVFGICRLMDVDLRCRRVRSIAKERALLIPGIYRLLSPDRPLS